MIATADHVAWAADPATCLLPAIGMERDAQLQFKVSDNNKDVIYFPADPVERSSEFQHGALGDLGPQSEDPELVRGGLGKGQLVVPGSRDTLTMARFLSRNPCLPILHLLALSPCEPVSHDRWLGGQKERLPLKRWAPFDVQIPPRSFLELGKSQLPTHPSLCEHSPEQFKDLSRTVSVGFLVLAFWAG